MLKSSILVLLLGVVAFSFPLLRGRTEDKPVSLTLEADSNEIVLGEPFSFRANLQNETNEVVQIRANLVPHIGNLKIEVSTDGENYKRFVTPGINSIEGGFGLLKLDTGDSFEIPVNIFWNDRPKLAHLSPAAADRVSRDRILTSLVFPEAGTYFVRAELANAVVNGVSATLKSKAVEIRVSQPLGDDAIVWEKIKDRPDIAFFLQEGWFRKVNAAERNLLEDELASLVATYPSSRIAHKVGKSLKRFKEKQSP